MIADAVTGETLGGIGLADARKRANPPGSLFKLAIALAAIDGGRVNPIHTYQCTGIDVHGTRTDRCWLPKGHGRVALREAIAQSCNLYFLDLARRVPSEDILASARRLGMLPDRGGAAPHLNDSTMLGEAFPTSPADMLQTALVLASRGRLGHTGLSLIGPRYDPLYDGLRACVRNGTAIDAWMKRPTIAGKTGTAWMPDAPRSTVGWFIGFAPAESPRYAIVVMVRRARSNRAAALAREILRRIM